MKQPPRTAIEEVRRRLAARSPMVQTTFKHRFWIDVDPGYRSPLVLPGDTFYVPCDEQPVGRERRTVLVPFMNGFVRRNRAVHEHNAKQTRKEEGKDE